jgi:hypothetical protein
MVCSLIQTDSCFELEDARGPYATRNECKERAAEIIENVKPALVNVQFYWKCVTVKPEYAT